MTMIFARTNFGGMTHACNMSAKNRDNHFFIFSPQLVRNSACILSNFGDFSFFISLIAFKTSSSVIMAERLDVDCISSS